MVSLRIQHCCFCISLRRGCIGIACYDIMVNLLIIILGPPNIIYHAERAVSICHCIGCGMLLLGALIESTVLLTFYLITSFVNSCILIVCFIIVTITNVSVNVKLLILLIIIIFNNCYFYIVAYSYYRQVESPFPIEHPEQHV